MNDDFKTLKERMRKLDGILLSGGLGHVEFAQAVSRLHRAARRADRSRQPSPQLQVLLERAEGLARHVG
ncbi:MAG TPA: hypothetical protein VLS93_10260 [Anaeromyxobacteraceae bacterium]|nr:hypothetical protein [Anaeromyxobacteraceae bacterium]